LHPIHVLENRSENGGREEQDGLGKDDRHDAGIIDLQREILRLSAIDLAADDTLRVGDGNAAGSLREGDDTGDDDDDTGDADAIEDDEKDGTVNDDKDDKDDEDGCDDDGDDE
jgi:hypothetical protein